MATAPCASAQPDLAQISPRRLIAWVAPVVAICVIFVAATVVVNVSPAVTGSTAHDASARLLSPYFSQNWRLFGPEPPDFVSQMLLQVRYRPAGAAASQPEVSTPVDVEARLDRLPSKNPIFPSKLPGYSLTLWRQFAEYASAAQTIDRLPVAVRAQAFRHLNRATAARIDVLTRFLSSWAAEMYSGQHILSVRCTFTTQADVRFRWRNDSTHHGTSRYIEYQSPWLPFVERVA